MISSEQATYYEILDVKPDASPHQIRDAYLRAKATFHKDSSALYTLITPEEREEMIRQIEDAYKILSSPQRRREYDQKHGFAVSYAVEEFNPGSYRKDGPLKKIVSIDRTPPMESGDAIHDDRLLIPPAMDQPLIQHSTSQPPIQHSTNQHSTPPVATENPPASLHFPTPPAYANLNATQQTGTPQAAAPHPAPKSSLQSEIESETEWSGAFLRKVREASSISIEEISNITKINKHYVLAIEEENYPKLPAAVYVRGFITQLAKMFRLPVERVVNAYLSRLIHAREKHQK